MKRYTLIPREIAAVQWTGTNIDEVKELCGSDTHVRAVEPSSSIIVRFRDNLMAAQLLDYVIRQEDGTIDVIDPSTFRDRYREPDCSTYEEGVADGYAAAYADLTCKSCQRPCGTPEQEKPKEQVNHPDHYLANGKECIDGMAECFGNDDKHAWLRCSAYKYLWRKGNKGPAETDIRKAQWCVDRHNSETGSALSVDAILRAIERFINS